MNKSENRYDISLPIEEQINKIIKKLNPNKATGPDKIAPETAILSASIIDSHLANIINYDLENSSFFEDAQIATVRPFTKRVIVDL